ncbi:jacalin-like lectin domain-containing protein [Artemisia annua]|uniref:Jacalin-like lectin domain-containing protein n=1 Tax=Artemisia annua TaxID=35608 RepID=A0A2U1KQT2_ARTAN|nr:jacalin-like lectin domain-containing protein [Artemisia annua]
MEGVMEGVQHLRIPLEEIKLATNSFSKENLIARGGFGNVYIGKLNISGEQSTVAVKRLDSQFGQGKREFLMEIQMLSCYKHKSLVCLVGFCDESGEKILVYEYVKHGSLDKYISDKDLSWLQRLKISLGAARGFSYLHNDVGPQHRVLHRDIKSANILLDDKFEARISDFGLSKIGPSNVEYTFLVTNACGTRGYVDPEYAKTDILTKESDVYSFGIVLFEILCGRLAIVGEYHDERRSLAALAKRCYEEDRLHDIIYPCLINQMNEDSLNVFSKVAYQCLKESRKERPTMGWIVEKLEKALEFQTINKVVGFIRVGTWGKRSEDPQNHWSFVLEKHHRLVKITVDHGDVIYSLMFTSKSGGVSETSENTVGCVGGDIVSKVIFDVGERITCINYGTVDIRDGVTILASLSFVTTKKIHGPYGRAAETDFSVPWDEGSLVGFYGIAGKYIESIGVHVKPDDDIMRVGTWGTTDPGGPQNVWIFQLKKNQHLEKITIEHGDLIYSLMFTTKYRGMTSTSKKAGGWNGGDKSSEVTLDWNEEINAIHGTVALSREPCAGYTIISSLSFVTNKKTHGPFGHARGTPFTVPWDDGSFAGFYGQCGYFIDSIGVLLKRTM